MPDRQMDLNMHLIKPDVKPISLGCCSEGVQLKAFQLRLLQHTLRRFQRCLAPAQSRSASLTPCKIFAIEDMDGPIQWARLF